MTKTTRSDPHRPSAVVPSEYTWVGSLDLNDNRHSQDEHDTMLALDRNNPHRSHARCAHCGAHITYVAVMRYHPDGVLVGWGFDCLETLSMLHDQVGRDLRRMQIARKARETEAQRVIAREQFAQDHPELHAFIQDALANPADHLDFVYDVARKWNREPERGLSERQLSALEKCRQGRIKFLERKAERERERAAEVSAPVPTDSERRTVRARLLKSEYKESEFGGRMVMTVKALEGYRLWGTMPSALDAADVGQWVQFDCRIEPSDSDETFGWIVRPTKAKLIDEPVNRDRKPEDMPF